MFISVIICFSSAMLVKADSNVMPTVYGSASILVKPNTTFSIPIYINNAQDAYALGFDINYDPDLIKLTGITKGSFMGSNNTMFNWGSNISGKVLVGITKYGRNVVGVNGNGLLFTLNFKSLALGSTTVDFSYCKIYDSTSNNNETNCSFTPINVTVSTSSKIRNSGDPVSLVLTIGKTTMTVDGKSGYKVGAAPAISSGVTYIPIRAVIEELGGTVDWNASNKNLVVTLNGKEISMFINKNIAYIDGMPVIIDPSNPKTYPKIVNGSTVVPLRFVAENLGMTVTWDAKLKTIKLDYIMP